MQLVRITHYRCGDYDCVTFVQAPADWDEDRINAEIGRAQTAYLAEFDKARVSLVEAGPSNPGYQPNFKAHPEKTVAEVQAEHETAKAIYDAWQADQYKTTRAFEDFLSDRGFARLWSEDVGTAEAECDWGHRHGHRLNYTATDTDSMPSPAKLAGVAEMDDDDFA